MGEKESVHVPKSFL